MTILAVNTEWGSAECFIEGESVDEEYPSAVSMSFSGSFSHKDEWTSWSNIALGIILVSPLSLKSTGSKKDILERWIGQKSLGTCDKPIFSVTRMIKQLLIRKK